MIPFHQKLSMIASLLPNRSQVLCSFIARKRTHLVKVQLISRYLLAQGSLGPKMKISQLMISCLQIGED